MEAFVRPTLFALLRYPSWRRVVVVLLAGLVCAVGVGWGCALWSRIPTSSIEADYPPSPGERWPEVHASYSGKGFLYTYKIGDRLSGKEIMYLPPYNSLPHVRRAGWPFLCLRSEVTPHDNYRHYEDDPTPPTPPRRRWHLPWSEIVSRGPSDREFPAFMRVQSDRRVPLIPMPAGLLINTLFYAAIFYPVLTLLRFVQLRLRRQPRGFEVAPVA